MNSKKFEELVNFLQNNTNIAEMIIRYGGSDKAIGDTSSGEYAAIERYLKKIDKDELDNFFI